MITMDIMAAAANPNHRSLTSLLGFPKKLSLIPYAGHFSAEIKHFVNFAITAYIHLPCDAHGFMGWFKPTSRLHAVLKQEPLSLLESSETYKSSEVVFDLWVLSRSLETHVTMFNFSFLAYTWGKNMMMRELQ